MHIEQILTNNLDSLLITENFQAVQRLTLSFTDLYFDTYWLTKGEPVRASWSYFTVRIVGGVCPGRMAISLQACLVCVTGECSGPACSAWGQEHKATAAESFCKVIAFRLGIMRLFPGSPVTSHSAELLSAVTQWNTGSEKLASGRGKWKFIHGAFWPWTSKLSGMLIHFTQEENGPRQVKWLLQGHTASLQQKVVYCGIIRAVVCFICCHRVFSSLCSRLVLWATLHVRK